MANIERILFPTDLSDQSRVLAPQVEAVVRSFQSELIVLNVLEAPSGYYKDWNAYLTLVNWEAIREDRERAVSAFARGAFKGLPMTYVMEEGDPAPTIVNYAREHAIDLIMMPTHGYGSFRSLLIGSTTAKVLHDTDISVWTSAHSSEPVTTVARYGRILCAVDLEEESIPQIQWAAELAAHWNATLFLAHVVQGAEAVDVSLQSALFSKARNELLKLQQCASVNVGSCVAFGPVGEAIRRTAIEHKADLVVMGRGHISETLGRLRTNAYSIIRQSPCPVVSVVRK